jgi:hypothetical protein
MKKSYAILIAILLLLPMLTVAVPVNASTGHPVLAAFWTGNWLAYGQANSNISVKAGDIIVQAIDGDWSPNLSPPSYLAIVTNFNGTNLVTFSGSQFDLYLSKDGYSTISPSDILYAHGFSVSDLSLPLDINRNVTVSNAYLNGGSGTFWLGNASGLTDWFTGGSDSINAYAQIILGPIPFHITSDYKYIKIFDGSTAAVAVSAQFVVVEPALSLTPTSGPSGATVTLSGTALLSNTLYNVSYDATPNVALAQVTTDANGTFTYTWNVEDLCKDSNNTVPIIIDVFNNGTTAFVDSVTYTEHARTIASLYSDYYGTDPGQFANYTETIPVNVFDNLGIQGLWFNPNAPVVISTEGTTLGTFNANSTGYFNVTVTVPILTLGDHNVTISNGGCKFLFTIDVLPTLIVTPDTGPAGTNVTFTCYGFPAGPVSLYWYSEYACNSMEDWTLITNATVGTDGQFNVTVPWTIPSTQGGYLEIAAGTFTSNTSFDEIADTYFLVVPTMIVTPSSLPANGSLFTVVATGLIPNTPYTIDIDNQAFALPNYFSYTYGYGSLSTDTGTVQFADSVVWSDACGNVTIQLVAAGFRPGEHVVALYTSSIDAGAFGGPYDGNFYTYGFGNYSLNSYALFTVTTAGDAVINATLTEINSTYLSTIGAQITSIQDNVATILTNTGTIQAAVSALDAKVTSLQGNVATVSTNLGTLTGTVTSIQGDVATIKTNVGTILATTTSIKSFLPVDLTPVWIAVILSLIAAIASIYGIIVIRSKIAA